jgi:hypothetical protein
VLCMMQAFYSSYEGTALHESADLLSNCPRCVAHDGPTKQAGKHDNDDMKVDGESENASGNEGGVGSTVSNCSYERVRRLVVFTLP